MASQNHVKKGRDKAENTKKLTCIFADICINRPKFANNKKLIGQMCFDHIYINIYL